MTSHYDGRTVVQSHDLQVSGYVKCDIDNVTSFLRSKSKKNRYIYIFIIHQSMLYELLINLIGSLVLYYDFILH